MAVTINGDGTITGPIIVQGDVGQTDPLLKVQTSDATVRLSLATTGVITSNPTLSDIEALALLGL